MRYTIKIQHKLDVEPKWEASGAFFPGTPKGLKNAQEHAEMLDAHPGNPHGYWIHRVFEYHGKRDYRPLEGTQ